MKKRNYLHSLFGGVAMAVTGLMGIPDKGMAQANYVSIFGDNTCGNESFTLNTFAPVSSTALMDLPSINDLSAPLNNKYPLAHSVYNNTGQVLFSVDRNGIYKPDGDRAYNFTSGYAATITALGSTFSVVAKEAVSEICTFPCTANKNNTDYFAVFWSRDGSSNYAVLRAIRIYIATSGALVSFTDNILYDASTSSSAPGMVRVSEIEGGLKTEFTIASDEILCNAPRDVYTTEPIMSTGPGGGQYSSSILRKWAFGADGSLPSPYAPTYFDKQYYASWLQQAKIINIGGFKYYAFASNGNGPFGDVSLDNARYVVCWDITNPRLASPAGTANVAVYDAGTARTNISGFECASADDSPGDLYVSRYNILSGSSPDAATSGIIRFPPILRGNVSTTFNTIPGTSDYCYTDLQFTGTNLFMVRGALSSANGGFPDGTLAYMPYASLVSMTPGLPIPLTRPCLRPRAFFSVLSRTNLSLVTPFYLGQGFRSNPLVFPEITDISITNRCAPGSPGATAANPQFATTVANTGGGSLDYLWTPAPPIYILPPLLPPVPVSVNNANLNDYTIRDPEIISVSGISYRRGLPVITAHFLLTVTNSQGCKATKEVKTELITSGFDLASRDSHFDLFNEANTQAINPEDFNIWASPDIFNRYYADGATYPFQHQHPNYAFAGPTTNYLYVNVKNVGCIDYIPPIVNPAVVRAYWTMGGFSGESWPLAWNGIGMTAPGAICGGTTTQPLGSELGSSPAALPFIATSSEATVKMPWTPPNPQLYYPPSCTSANPFMAFCLLSRIVDGHNASCTDGMTICETTDPIRDNINNNNNITTINTRIAYVNSLPNPRRHIIIAGNAGLTDAAFNLQFINDIALHPSAPASSLANFVTIKVFLGELFDIWQAAGSSGTFTETDAKEKSVTFNGSKTTSLHNILMKAGTTYPVTLEFRMLAEANPDYMPEETVNFRQIALERPIDTLIDSITVSYVDTVYDSTQTVHYDTLYATKYDTVYHQADSVYGNFSFLVRHQPTKKGVLAVSEISNGPSGECEYAEMVVANCSSDTSDYVDIRGWIIDDNAGNFDSSGCTTGVGITPGHYRLAFDNIWRDVPVGSVLVMYNHDANCYRLSDSFRIDTTQAGLIYWLPVGARVAAPYSTPIVERFGSMPSSSICSYCSDTDSTYYTAAAEWSNTIGLNDFGDALQVRCPGCNATYSREPDFYHGIGYGPSTDSGAFASITPGNSDLGGPVVIGSGGGYKFVFTGSTGSELGSSSMWSKIRADAVGSAPPTLGNVNTSFMTALIDHSLDLPCCGKSGEKSSRAPVAAATLASNEIKVYPNPTKSVIYVELSKAANATVKLMDVTGRLIDETRITNDKVATFNVRNYAPGLYIYQVTIDGKIHSGKVVVQK